MKIYVGFIMNDSGEDVVVPWNESTWLVPEDEICLLGTGVDINGLEPLNVPIFDN